MEGSAAGTAAAGVHGFPAVLTSFVGRAGPVREVAGLVGECRLVTVTGPGGVGKTRLAGEVARQVAGRFADGVWLVELAPVGDPAVVPAVVAAALGVREQALAARAPGRGCRRWPAGWVRLGGLLVGPGQGGAERAERGGGDDLDVATGRDLGVGHQVVPDVERCQLR